MSQQSVYFVALLIYFANLALNRFLMERNDRLLCTEDKIKLLDTTSTHRSLATHVPLGLVVASFFIGNFSQTWESIIFSLGLILAIISSALIQVAVMHRSHQLHNSPLFIQQFGKQVAIVQLLQGVAAMLIVYAAFVEQT
jgi:hypothetical protein